MTTFSQFEKQEHKKRVKHFVNFINAHDHNVTVNDCMEVFGFDFDNAKPIFEEAKAEAIFG